MNTHRLSNKTFVLLLMLIASVGLVATGCEGPAGPQGEPGPEGEQGAQGPQGEQGEEGTANVIYSEWLDIEWNNVDSATAKSMLIDEPRVLEDEFQATGTILVYLKENIDVENWAVVQVPYMTDSYRFFYMIADAPDLDLEGLYLGAESVDGGTIPDLTNGAGQVRYVLIPGGVPAKLHAEFFDDYEALAEYYGFPK